jgi:hypothetical protein
MTAPTRGECFSKLLEHLRLAQEEAAKLAHLHNADGDGPGMALGRGWLHISEHLRNMQYNVTQLAKRGLQ